MKSPFVLVQTIPTTPVSPPNGKSVPTPGYRVLGQLPADPALIPNPYKGNVSWFGLQVGPDVPVPAGAVVLLGTQARDVWDWADSKSKSPVSQISKWFTEALYQATMVQAGQSVTYKKRCKVAEIPAGATVVLTDLPPHIIAGDL